MPTGQIILGDRHMALLGQCLACVTPDKARTSGDKDIQLASCYRVPARQ